MIKQTLFFILICICFSHMGAASGNHTAKTQSVIAIENITIVDPKSGVHPNMSLLIVDGRIQQLGKDSAADTLKNKQVINGQGKYLIPGLWDMHVHFTFDAKIGERMFPLFIANGVTSVRDTGGPLEQVLAWRKRANSGAEAAPHVYVAGPLLDGSPHVYDGGTAAQPGLGIGIKKADAVRRTVDYMAAKGVDFIKAYELLTDEAFRALMEQAKLHHLPVAGHVPLSMDVTNVSRLGLNSIEHLRNIELECADNASQLKLERQNILATHDFVRGHPLRKHIHESQRPRAINNYNAERCAALANILAENNTQQVPTLGLVGFPLAKNYARQGWLDTFSYLSTDTEKQWKKFADQKKHAETDANRLAYAKWGFDLVKKMHSEGVTIMAGTDTPILLQTPGFSLHEELVHMVRAGLSPLQALQTATLHPPKFFGLEAETGSIETGKLADLVILDANPLDDIRNTQKINAVISRGHYYNRTSLDNMLKKLAAK